jgi:L-ascorbate oxidase
VDGEPQLMRWAMNNISNVHGSTPLISLAVEASRSLGWPAAVEHTMDIPLDPPFIWNYTAKVNETGGPGATVGHMVEGVMSFEEGQVVELVLQNARALNGVAEFHPWHMHGHSYWIVGQGQGIYDAEIEVPKYNLENPVLRDTLVLQPLGWVAIRFLADNPGAWLFHCHISKL